tara:strand:+ start:706 stop:939 length:234 start_codon:yes stop_codon:yes gene_type:complete
VHPDVELEVVEPLVVNADRFGRTLLVVTVSANAEDDISRNAISQRINRFRTILLGRANPVEVEAEKIPFPLLPATAQ